MKILMLGWEYPPHISGGLGTACEGLTKALARQGVEIDFIVPHLFGGEKAAHMQLFGAKNQGLSHEPSATPGRVQSTQRQHQITERVLRLSQADGIHSPVDEPPVAIRTWRIPSYLSPYLKAGDPYAAWLDGQGKLLPKWSSSYLQHFFGEQMREVVERLPELVRSMFLSATGSDESGSHYSGNLMSEVGRYAAQVIKVVQNRSYDVIHVHDWMTFPAGVALKAITGLPLIVHVHSLEFDRSGENGNQQIIEIEKLGLDFADKVIAVSQYTKSLIHKIHGTALDKIGVVHNGVYSPQTLAHYQEEKQISSKIVLFLGRVTFQKGPDYFVKAAARVVPHFPNVVFVMAGSGDMLPRMIEEVAAQGLQRNFLFTGFLKGKDVERVFSMADLYVMPSVSEPFGISALEAISYNTPVIISKQSGVSEVLNHALKVDFWDIDQMVNLIISVLRYPELGQDMTAMAREEVQRLRWDSSALTAITYYNEVVRREAEQEHYKTPRERQELEL